MYLAPSVMQDSAGVHLIVARPHPLLARPRILLARFTAGPGQVCAEPTLGTP